jgi:hypothetical protein
MDRFVLVGGPGAGRVVHIDKRNDRFRLPILPRMAVFDPVGEAHETVNLKYATYTRRTMYFRGEPPLEIMADSRLSDRQAWQELADGYLLR